MNNPTSRLARISADTGLSIDEAQEALDDGIIKFSKIHKRYYVDYPKSKQQKAAEYKQRIQQLHLADEERRMLN